MVGMARCAVPVAERSVRRRNESPATGHPPQSFRPLDAGGDIAARCPCQNRLPALIAMILGTLLLLAPPLLGETVVQPGDGALTPARLLHLHPMAVPANPKLPTLFIIGDSTVHNGTGVGAGGQWGWGEPLVAFFNTNKI